MVSAYNDWDDPAAQSLVWLENDGRMRFTLHDAANTPTHLITLGVGDLTGDGRPDLVTGGMHIEPAVRSACRGLRCGSMAGRRPERT